jgi:NAD(P)-dependent dehydrogenase (short-subunit alcohol dehydrogenase family)
MSVQGKVVVVTGAARGVGAGLARELTRRGARVALLGLEPQELQALAAVLPGSAAYEVDVTDAAALTDVAQRVVADLGRVDVVVANAGIAAAGPLLLADERSYDRVLEVNLLGSIRTVRAFLPHVVASRGYVLQVASLAAMAPAPVMSAYCASKSGVEAFAHCLRGEVRHHGVDVGVAYLAFTDTDMVRGTDQVRPFAEMRRQMPGPFGRTYPLGPAVVRLADGVERRSAHVYAQRWLRGVQPLRHLLPALTARAARDLPALEDQLRQAGAAATTPVGAGGSADTVAASSRT